MMNNATEAGKALTILIAAGGTGGHIFPGLALAAAFRRAGARVEWLGAGGMECDLARAHNLPLSIAEFKSPRGLLGWLSLPPAVWRAIKVARQVKPDAVMAMGGYASVPGGLAARVCGAYLFIHEQNAIMGRANQLLSWFAHIIFTGFAGAHRMGVDLGNPTRDDFVVGDAAVGGRDDDERVWNVLVLGGSQGARSLNRIVPAALALAQDKSMIESTDSEPSSPAHEKTMQGQTGAAASSPPMADAAVKRHYAVCHQCGRGNLISTRQAYGDATSVKVDVSEFVTDVAARMQWADLIICRAGASTLAEAALAARGAVILVPYPYAAANHQFYNARQWADEGGALLCEEKDLTAESLAEIIGGLSKAAAAAMKRRRARLRKPTAAADIAGETLRFINYRRKAKSGASARA